MRIVRVMGVAVATVKDQRLEGSKLLLVAAADQAGQVQGESFLALDVVGAGAGELVVIVEGSTARVAAGNANQPVDAVVVAILDSLRYDGQVTYSQKDN
jgi:ethanolamine utilization protein EutN